MEAAEWVRAGLVLAWALAGVVLCLRGTDASASSRSAAAAVGGVCAATAPPTAAPRAHVVAASLIPAVALHLELVIPDGSSASRPGATATSPATSPPSAPAWLLAAADRLPAVPAVAAAVGGAPCCSACRPPTRPTCARTGPGPPAAAAPRVRGGGDRRGRPRAGRPPGAGGLAGPRRGDRGRHHRARAARPRGRHQPADLASGRPGARAHGVGHGPHRRGGGRVPRGRDRARALARPTTSAPCSCCRCWPRPWPRWPTSPPATGWPRAPTGSCTASASPPTRCCAPGAAA